MPFIGVREAMNDCGPLKLLEFPVKRWVLCGALPVDTGRMRQVLMELKLD